MARGAWAIAVVAAAGAGLAAVMTFAPAPAPEPERAPPAVVAPPPSVADGEGGSAPDIRPPAFDLVRIEPDGRAMIAGAAEPGATVEILLDGVVLATALADGGGAFVADVAIAAGEGLLRLDLRARGGDGPSLSSLDPVFVNAPALGGPDQSASPPGASAASDPGEPPAAEPEAPMVVAARDDGADLLQAPRRAAGAPVTLDLVSYGADGEVELRGRAAPGRLVRVYAGGRLLAEAPVAPDGRWAARGGIDLTPGAHVLRIDELDGGRVTSRIETPFRREAPELLALNPGEVVVQPGDSLWRIAQDRYGSGRRYMVIYAANAERIRDPDLIYPGQVFATPAAAP